MRYFILLLLFYVIAVEAFGESQKPCKKTSNVNDKSMKCTPHVSFKKDCNICVCGADGTPACTRKNCGPTNENPRTFKLRKKNKNKGSMKKGGNEKKENKVSYFVQDCNSCVKFGKDVYCHQMQFRESQ
uniref:CSON010972 protein n=1 Tax=Culicoides sonorensis TaxID=179676 RepID=A0A336LPS3_CULSO